MRKKKIQRREDGAGPNRAETRWDDGLKEDVRCVEDRIGRPARVIVLSLNQGDVGPCKRLQVEVVALVAAGRPIPRLTTATLR